MGGSSSTRSIANFSFTCNDKNSLSTGSLFGERVGWKNREERERKKWEPADHLSARSLSVTWIHWNVVNFMCKKGVGRQHTAFTFCQNAALSNEFFLWWVDYALEGLVLTETMQFLALISYWGVVTCTLTLCGYCFLLVWFASDARTFIAAKKTH